MNFLQDEGWNVEFEIDHDDNGKAKAVSVTAPGGGPCFGPRNPQADVDATVKAASSLRMRRLI
jgi:hypothetical protein